MSMDMMATDRVCYVNCNFCNTTLAKWVNGVLGLYMVSAPVSVRQKSQVHQEQEDIVCESANFKKLRVSVPCNSLLTVVTVRCGHCANLLSANMGASLQTFPPLDLQKQHLSFEESSSSKELGSSSSKCNKFAAFEAVEHEQPRIPPIRPPEKRQRVPSAYNRFIKEEIQRIKASNPDISHREAFSTAAKNWAHFPHIHFGLKLDGNTSKQS